MIYIGPALGVLGLAIAVLSGDAVSVGVCAGLLVATVLLSTRQL